MELCGQKGIKVDTRRGEVLRLKIIIKVDMRLCGQKGIRADTRLGAALGSKSD